MGHVFLSALQFSQSRWPQTHERGVSDVMFLERRHSSNVVICTGFGMGGGLDDVCLCTVSIMQRRPQAE